MSETSEIDLSDELFEAVAVCGACASACICIEPPEHTATEPPEPHVCKCGGSWRGTWEGGDFEVVTYPAGAPRWLEIEAGGDEDEP